MTSLALNLFFRTKRAAYRVATLATLLAAYAAAVFAAHGFSPSEVRVALQQCLDEAAERSVVDFEMTEFATLDAPLRVGKPLTVRGLRLQLPPKLTRTALLVADVEGFELTDSHFRGNADTVGQNERASLVEIRAGQFRVERCSFDNASKNGLTIDPGDSDKPLVGGVIRDIVGRGVVRDVVSLSGGSRGGTVRDILVENVYASDSSHRGAVEVSDRSWDVTVRGVTAERCVYAIDVQDHDLKTDINRNVLLEDIRARHCRHAVRTATDPIGHSGLTIRDVVAEDCDVPLRIDHISDVLIEGVRILGRERDPTEPEDLESVIRIKGCNNITVRDVTARDLGKVPTVVRVVDTVQLRIDGLSVEGDTRVEQAVRVEARKQVGDDKQPSVEPVLQNIRTSNAKQGEARRRTVQTSLHAERVSKERAWSPDQIVALAELKTSASPDIIYVATAAGLEPDTLYQFRLEIDDQRVRRSDEWSVWKNYYGASRGTGSAGFAAVSKPTSVLLALDTAAFMFCSCPVESFRRGQFCV